LSSTTPRQTHRRRCRRRHRQRVFSALSRPPVDDRVRCGCEGARRRGRDARAIAPAPSLPRAVRRVRRRRRRRRIAPRRSPRASRSTAPVSPAVARHRPRLPRGAHCPCRARPRRRARDARRVRVRYNAIIRPPSHQPRELHDRERGDRRERGPPRRRSAASLRVRRDEGP